MILRVISVGITIVSVVFCDVPRQFINKIIGFGGRLEYMRLRLFEVRSCLRFVADRLISAGCLISFFGSISPNVQWRHSTCNDLCMLDTV